ncbi:Olfactory receptor 14C36 [Sciurus carolinensis]|uniref:Olfactory receptor 14C36 n=1 Tax=Sciurus carolinensis TaxID=30640 RepID=A0AA41N3D3_SCICA|nr:Olfactory receptor 14C36 [Sciurus carolinensis]
MVTEFLPLGSPDGWNMRVLYFTVFTVTYLGTMLGNLLIVTDTTADQNLHKPMYFFLRNLSILDMCFISITVPNACVNSLIGNRTILVAGSATQIFLVIFCAYVEIMFLSIMAWDHSVTIFQPLQYPIIMNPQFCVHMTLASLLSGLVYAGVYLRPSATSDTLQNIILSALYTMVPPLLNPLIYSLRNKQDPSARPITLGALTSTDGSLLPGHPDQLTVPYHWDHRPTDCTSPPGSYNHTKHTQPPGPLPD